MVGAAQIRIDDAVQQLLRCPACHSGLLSSDSTLACVNMQCHCHFPIVDGIPILIDEKRSVFSIAGVRCGRETYFTPASRFARLCRSLVPSVSSSAVSADNYVEVRRLLTEMSDGPKVLVVGGSVAGRGMEALLSEKAIQLLESDVSIGPRTAVVCDAHSLPFEDGSFDGVIIQAVLEHVVDPYACVEEIHRVLKDGGLVYAETPLMQQVHGGRYDFTRFTHLGHRRLFRRFDEIHSGAVAGAAVALAWAYEYFLLSLTKSSAVRPLIRAFARMTSFWLKYVDSVLINRPSSLDAASACYFIGRKTRRAVEDRDLIQLYRGAD